MTHFAKLPLDLRLLPVTLGDTPVSMIGHIIEVEVEYTFRAGLPATEEAPAEQKVFGVVAVKLGRTLAMHDPADCMSLIIGAGAEVLRYLSQLQISWIEENLPVPPV